MSDQDDLYALGLDGKDRVAANLGGGIPKGALTFIEGPDGGGKSTWCQRFVEGFCTEGYHVTYMTPELTSAEFISQMHSLGYGAVDYLLDKQMLFLHADIDTKEYIGDDASIRHLLERLVKAQMMWEADIIIIDGLTSILRHDPKMDEIIMDGESDHAIQNFISFLNKLTLQGKSVIVTANPEPVPDETFRPFRNQSDIYIEIEKNSIGQEIRRNLKVHRYANRNQQVDDQIGYQVQSGTGIIIESRTVA